MDVMTMMIESGSDAAVVVMVTASHIATCVVQSFLISPSTFLIHYSTRMVYLKHVI